MKDAKGRSYSEVLEYYKNKLKMESLQEI